MVRKGDFVAGLGGDGLIGPHLDIFPRGIHHKMTERDVPPRRDPFGIEGDIPGGHPQSAVGHCIFLGAGGVGIPTAKDIAHPDEGRQRNGLSIVPGLGGGLGAVVPIQGEGEGLAVIIELDDQLPIRGDDSAFGALAVHRGVRIGQTFQRPGLGGRHDGGSGGAGKALDDIVSGEDVFVPDAGAPDIVFHPIGGIGAGGPERGVFIPAVGAVLGPGGDGDPPGGDPLEALEVIAAQRQRGKIDRRTVFHEVIQRLAVLSALRAKGKAHRPLSPAEIEVHHGGAIGSDGLPGHLPQLKAPGDGPAGGFVGQPLGGSHSGLGPLLGKRAVQLFIIIPLGIGGILGGAPLGPDPHALVFIGRHGLREGVIIPPAIEGYHPPRKNVPLSHRVGGAEMS